MHDTRQQRAARRGMSERRFVLVDFTHTLKLRLVSHFKNAGSRANIVGKDTDFACRRV
jgi:hypothetical protein